MSSNNTVSAGSLRLKSETLLVLSANTIPNLAFQPTTKLQNFVINGNIVNALDAGSGISVTGQVVTVNSTALGFNISVDDLVTVQYSY